MKRTESNSCTITDPRVAGSKPPLRATRRGNGSRGSQCWSGNRTKSSRSSPRHDACGRVRPLATRDWVSVLSLNGSSGDGWGAEGINRLAQWVPTGLGAL